MDVTSKSSVFSTAVSLSYKQGICLMQPKPTSETAKATLTHSQACAPGSCPRTQLASVFSYCPSGEVDYQRKDRTEQSRWRRKGRFCVVTAIVFHLLLLCIPLFVSSHNGSIPLLTTNQVHPPSLSQSVMLLFAQGRTGNQTITVLYLYKDVFLGRGAHC